VVPAKSLGVEIAETIELGPCKIECWLVNARQGS
jgi:hypothetical protein